MGLDLKFVTIDENSKWLSAVQKLGDNSRLTLGFMPAQAFVDYAKRKQILGLIIDGELVAYTMFRYKKILSLLYTFVFQLSIVVMDTQKN